MNPKFEAACHERGDGVTYVKIAGVIDEDHGLDALTAQLRTSLRVVIDLSEVERVNAAGAEAMRLWLKELGGCGLTVGLDRVAPAVVARLNENPAFVGQASVRSFLAPYYCAKCETEQGHLLRLEDVAGGCAPNRVCTECGAAAEFDDEPEYFRFVSRGAAPGPVGS